MHLASALVSLVAVISIAACSSSTTGSPGSSGSSGSSGDGGSADGGPGDTTPAADSGSGSDGATTGAHPAASSTDAPVSIGGTCAAFVACGGAPQGTYDYTAGCLADTFTAAKAQCPALDTTNAKVSVTGSLYFVGPALTRDAVVKVSGSIVVPASCSSGQCAAVQAALASGFDTVSCTGTADCTCTVAKTTTVKNATTFVVNADTLTTDDGESYEICAQGSTFRYSGKSLGSEGGNWELAKRP